MAFSSAAASILARLFQLVDTAGQTLAQWGTRLVATSRPRSQLVLWHRADKSVYSMIEWNTANNTLDSSDYVTVSGPLLASENPDDVTVKYPLYGGYRDAVDPTVMTAGVGINGGSLLSFGTTTDFEMEFGGRGPANLVLQPQQVYGPSSPATVHPTSATYIDVPLNYSLDFDLTVGDILHITSTTEYTFTSSGAGGVRIVVVDALSPTTIVASTPGMTIRGAINEQGIAANQLIFVPTAAGLYSVKVQVRSASSAVDVEVPYSSIIAMIITNKPLYTPG